MSNLSHPMIRRSERGPRAEADGGKEPSNWSSAQPHKMESHLVSSDTTTESQDTDSSDELTEPVAAEMLPSVSGSPGVRMGVSGNAIPVPEVEPEDPVEANTNIDLVLQMYYKQFPPIRSSSDFLIFYFFKIYFI